MSTQVDFTPDEWNVLVHAPAEASAFIVNADKTGGIQGQFGMFQETKDARTVVENAANAGDTELVRQAAHSLMEEQSWKSLLQNASPEHITNSLDRVRQIVDSKVAAPEATSYKRYVYDVARRTASAAKESGPTQTSPKEAVALQQVADLLDLTL